MSETPEKWERLPGELSKWFDRFDRYRLLGPTRSIDAVWRLENAARPPEARKRGKRPPPFWYQIVKDFRWKERAEAWDENTQRLRLQAEAEERAAMLKRHLEGGRWLQRVALEKIYQLKAVDMTPAEARQFLEKGINIERVASGLPADLLGLVSLSDEELLAKYANVLKTIGNNSGGNDAAGDTPAGGQPSGSPEG